MLSKKLSNVKQKIAGIAEMSAYIRVQWVCIGEARRSSRRRSRPAVGELLVDNEPGYGRKPPKKPNM